MVFSLIVLMFFVIEGNRVVEGEDKIIIYTCNLEDCIQQCKAAWGPKFDGAFCQHTKYGDRCVCGHTASLPHKGSRKNLLMF